MKLHDLHNVPGAKKKRMRVGRGDSSGRGKTSGRGDKGQGSRTGSKTRLHFEGGQIPLFRRLPKKGFKSPFHKEYTIINLTELNDAFEADAVIDIAILMEKGMIPRKLKTGLKVLATGEITKPVTVKANLFSKSAQEKIEAAGGKCELI